MAAYSPPGLTDVANLALLEIGAQPIEDIDQENGESAPACRSAIWQAVREVGRSHNWNCLKLRANLTQLTFGPASSAYGGTAIGWPGCQPSVPPPYWLPNTLYTGGTLVTYGQAIYYFLGPMGPAVSSNNFLDDVSAGLWAQLYSSFFQSSFGPAGGKYEWQFGYALPSDFLLVDELNGVSSRSGAGKGVGSLYEVYINQTKNADQTISSVGALFCNTPYADLKYTALIQDPTVWDPLFVGCVAVLLGSKIATLIRGDDGKMAASLKSKYDSSTLPWAILKDSGERKDYRYDPVKESNFIRSRWNSTNG